MHSLGLFLFFRKLIICNVFRDGCWCTSCLRCCLTGLRALFCTNTRSDMLNTKSSLEGGNGLPVHVWCPAGLSCCPGTSPGCGRSRRRGVYSRIGQNPKVFFAKGAQQILAHMGVAFPQHWLALLCLGQPWLIPAFLTGPVHSAWASPPQCLGAGGLAVTLGLYCFAQPSREGMEGFWPVVHRVLVALTLIIWCQFLADHARICRDKPIVDTQEKGEFPHSNLRAGTCLTPRWQTRDGCRCCGRMGVLMPVWVLTFFLFYVLCILHTYICSSIAYCISGWFSQYFSMAFP